MIKINKILLNYTYNNKYNNLKKFNYLKTYHITAIIDFLISLMKAYIYMYKCSQFNYKFLFLTSKNIYQSLFKEILWIPNIYYFTNNIKPGFFTNWFFYKKNLILLKWLTFLLNSNLNQFQNNNIYNKYLINLYLKLNIKYKGLKNILEIPDIIIFITPEYDKIFIKEMFLLNKSIIVLSNNTYFDRIFRILTINSNYITKKFVVNILTTACLHYNFKN